MRPASRALSITTGVRADSVTVSADPAVPVGLAVPEDPAAREDLEDRDQAVQEEMADRASAAGEEAAVLAGAVVREVLLDEAEAAPEAVLAVSIVSGVRVAPDEGQAEPPVSETG